VVGELGFVIVAVPDSTVHVPIPTVGVLALITKVPLLHCSISGSPASATAGGARLVSTTSSEVSVQVPLDIRHRRVAEVPAGTPVTCVRRFVGVTMVAVPLTSSHTPLPTAGLLPAIVNVPSLQFSWSGPATEAEGGAWLVRTISSKLSVHVPLEIVQRSRAKSPAGTPVTVVVGEDGFVIVTLPAPSSTVQVPVPTTGVLAFRRNVPLLHCSICGSPASATVGDAWLVRTTSSKVSVQVPLDIRQRSVADVPAGTPVTCVLRSVASTMVAVPLTSSQTPVPTTGSLPFMVNVPSLQFSWSGPASAADGGA